MQHSIKTAVYLLIILLTGYICFGYFITRAVNNLNLAREEELKAVTMQQGLLRKLSKDGLARVMRRQAPNRQENEYDFTDTATENPSEQAH